MYIYTYKTLSFDIKFTFNKQYLSFKKKKKPYYISINLCKEGIYI